MTDPLRTRGTFWRGSRWAVAARLALAVAALVVAIVIGFVVYWEVALRSALARIRDAGDPVLPAEIARAPSDGGGDPSRWLAELAHENEGRLGHWDVEEPDDAAELLARARAGEFPSDVGDALQILDGCRRTNPDWSEPREYLAWKELDRALSDARRLTQLSECQLAALRARSVKLRPFLEQLVSTCEFGCEDSLGCLQGMTRIDEIAPPNWISAVLLASRVLGESAVAEAFRGQPLIAVHRLELACCLVHVIDQRASVLEQDMRDLIAMRMVGALRSTLPLLPRGLDLSRVEAALAPIDPRTEWVQVMKAERARLHWIHEHGDQIIGTGTMRDLARREPFTLLGG